MQYDWIDFYTEFATKLLPFKADRKALIQKIYAVYDTAGISVPNLQMIIAVGFKVNSERAVQFRKESMLPVLLFT